MVVLEKMQRCGPCGDARLRVRGPYGDARLRLGLRATSCSVYGNDMKTKRCDDMGIGQR